jgi:hypothetical protein
MYRLKRKLPLLALASIDGSSHAQLPPDIRRIITLLLLECTLLPALQVKERLQSLSLKQVDRLDSIVSALYKLHLNEKNMVRLCGLTSLERCLLYKYRDWYGGISLEVMESRGARCRKCDGDGRLCECCHGYKDGMCRDCRGSGMTRGAHRRDVRITAT